ncbi:hypothetical protein Tco_1052464 [Tanacetum coccineum]
MIESWKLLRAHAYWKEVGLPTCLKIQEKTSKKSKTSETTSYTTSDSTHGDFNLNEDTDDLGAEEEEVQEVRPRARTYLRIKRHSPSSFEIFTAHALVKRADALGAIEIEETNVCTIKREELELKHQVIQFKHEVKMDKDIMFCNELDDHLTIQLAADDISAQVSVVQNPQLYRFMTGVAMKAETWSKMVVSKAKC